MPLRVGIDLDGTLADLSSAYQDVARRLFGDSQPERAVTVDERDLEASVPEADAPEPDDKAALKAARRASAEQRQVWEAIRHTPDFWLGLEPIEPGIVGRLHDASLSHGWEVFFVTQRPGTAGQTVQRQTQQWLMREGFVAPSVLTLAGGRGRAAAALELDVLLDDNPRNCVDVVSESTCRPMLVLREPSATAESAARQMRIEVVRSVAEAVTRLQTPQPRPQPPLMRRVLDALGLE